MKRLIFILEVYLPSLLSAVDRKDSSSEPKKAVVKWGLVVPWDASGQEDHVFQVSVVCVREWNTLLLFLCSSLGDEGPAEKASYSL